MNNDHPIRTLEQYLSLAEDPLSFLFRGVTRINEHKLIPSVVRGWNERTFLLPSLERRLLSDFKRRALPWLSAFRPNNDWEWMMLAQHHGVPTRPLDWTMNPLAALFFACRGYWEEQGAVYALRKLPLLEIDIVKDPFQVDQDYYILPPHISPRIAA